MALESVPYSGCLSSSRDDGGRERFPDWAMESSQHGSALHNNTSNANQADRVTCSGKVLRMPLFYYPPIRLISYREPAPLSSRHRPSQKSRPRPPPHFSFSRGNQLPPTGAGLQQPRGTSACSPTQQHRVRLDISSLPKRPRLSCVSSLNCTYSSHYRNHG